MPSHVTEKQSLTPMTARKIIQNRTIQTVGSPDERFAEDALRMIRALRIASELGFKIGPTTLAAIQKNNHLLKEIALERIRDELLKLLASPLQLTEFL